MEYNVTICYFVFQGFYLTTEEEKMIKVSMYHGNYHSLRLEAKEEENDRSYQRKNIL